MNINITENERNDNFSSENVEQLEKHLINKFYEENNQPLVNLYARGSSVSSNSNKNPSKKIPPLANQSALPRKQKVDQIMRKLDQEYSKQIKQTEKAARNKDKLYDELNMYKKMVNDLKRVNRDEELLRMQKENQEIEAQLIELKKKDKSELKEKKDDCQKLIERLNTLFIEKKKEAGEKEKERERAIQEIKAIKREQQDHLVEIDKLKKDKERLTTILDNLDKDVENYKVYKTFIDQVIEKYSNDSLQNDLYDNLKEKFEQLMEKENEIKNNILECKKEKEDIKKQLQELRRRNDKQEQNTKLVELENEIKKYADLNKQLELDIDEHREKNKNKNSDTDQIKRSISNLYDKVKPKDGKKNLKKNDKKDDDNIDEGDTKQCEKLDKINERLIELLKIHKRLEELKLE
jgi:hypothetical protein